MLYGSGNGCDCGCGAHDPDCNGFGCTAPDCVTPYCDYCFNQYGVMGDCSIGGAAGFLGLH